jgi:hypothetical protein
VNSKKYCIFMNLFPENLWMSPLDMHLTIESITAMIRPLQGNHCAAVRSPYASSGDDDRHRPFYLRHPSESSP